MIPPAIEIHAHFSSHEKKEMDKQCHFLEEWYRCRTNQEVPKVEVFKVKFVNIEGLYTDNTIYMKKRKHIITTFLHELNHAYQWRFPDTVYEKIIGNIIDDIPTGQSDYWTESWEVHSRIMELRYINNLNPNQHITPEAFKKLKIPEKLNLRMYSNEQLIKNLNSTI